MQTLFLELTLLVSLAIVVYLMAAAVPRVEGKADEEKEQDSTRRTGHHFDKLDKTLLKVKDKFLRKLKIVVLKADNFISKQLKSKKD